MNRNLATCYHERRAMRRRATFVSLGNTLAVACLVAGATAVLVSQLSAPYVPEVEYVAYGMDGARYVAGAGDTCRDAMRGAVMPAAYSAARCEMYVRGIGQ